MVQGRDIVMSINSCSNARNNAHINNTNTRNLDEA